MIRDEIGKRLDREAGAPGKLADAVVFGITVSGRFLVSPNAILGPGGSIGEKPARGKVGLVPGAPAVKISVDQIARANRIEVIDRTELVEIRFGKSRPSPVLDEAADVVKSSRAKTGREGRFADVSFHDDQGRSDPAFGASDELIEKIRRIIDDIGIDPENPFLVFKITFNHALSQSGHCSLTMGVRLTAQRGVTVIVVNDTTILHALESAVGQVFGVLEHALIQIWIDGR